MKAFRITLVFLAVLAPAAWLCTMSYMADTESHDNRDLPRVGYETKGGDTKSVAEPAAEPVAEPAAEPAAEPVAESPAA